MNFVTCNGRILASWLSLSICAACGSSTDEDSKAASAPDDAEQASPTASKSTEADEVAEEGSESDSEASPEDDDLGPGTDSSEPGTCSKSVIDVHFPALYSAYDGEQLFQVPATVNGIAPSSVEWSLSDPEIADLENTPEGVMLTIQKAGKATLVAVAGSLCGASELTVTEVDAEQWEIGSARYNDGVVITGGRGRPDMQPTEPVEAACTSCHGESATTGGFQTIAHTPTQTAGFSDEELIKVFTEGVLSEGAYFDESIVPIGRWERFHKWGMTDEQKQAMVVYLRSLTPSDQTGERVRRMNGGGDSGMGSPSMGGEAAGGMGGAAQ